MDAARWWIVADVIDAPNRTFVRVISEELCRNLEDAIQFADADLLGAGEENWEAPLVICRAVPIYAMIRKDGENKLFQITIREGDEEVVVKFGNQVPLIQEEETDPEVPE